MKRSFLRVTVLYLTAATALLIIPGAASAEVPGDAELEAELERQLEEYDLADWEAYYDGLPNEVRELWGGGMEELISGFVSGETENADIGERLKVLLLSGLKRSLAPLGTVLGIALMSGLVGVLLEGGTESGMGAAASFVCLGMFAAAAVSILLRLAAVSLDTVERLMKFTQSVSPVIATMLAATGSVAGGGLVQPLTVMISDTMMSFFRSAVLPLILAGAGIAVAAGFAGKRKLDRLFDTVKTVLKWVIGIAFTVFLGVGSIRGISAAGADSLSVRTRCAYPPDGHNA